MKNSDLPKPHPVFNTITLIEDDCLAKNISYEEAKDMLELSSSLVSEIHHPAVGRIATFEERQWEYNGDESDKFRE